MRELLVQELLYESTSYTLFAHATLTERSHGRAGLNIDKTTKPRGGQGEGGGVLPTSIMPNFDFLSTGRLYPMAKTSWPRTIMVRKRKAESR